jgi:hypothetical protein
MAVRRRQRHSARVVLWALGLLAGAHLAWSLLPDRPDLRDAEYGTRLKHLQHRLAQAPGRPLVLMFGSSRTLMGLAADRLPPGTTGSQKSGPLVFNMGITAAGPVNELIALRRVLDLGIRPRAVIVEVLPRTLCAFPGDTYLQEAVADQRRTWKDRDILPPGAQWPYLLDFLTPPWSALRFGLMHHLAPGWEATAKRQERYQTTPCGWLPWSTIPSPAQRAEGVRRSHDEYAPVLGFTSINQKADAILRMLFDECRRNGIEVLALVTLPECSDFLTWYGPGTRELMIGYLTSLCQEHRSRYVNATTWLPDDAFADGHHLVRPGAEAFTARLWREVLEPWAQKQ